ncbi:hypothetical protein R1flu_004756 [Riccia fluitans]|uniref:Uncharacterized protein n=1 Tax=Riccia fluitans TaxID=41844 RepID=A0ABD1YV73_9MARC
MGKEQAKKVTMKCSGEHVAWRSKVPLQGKLPGNVVSNGKGVAKKETNKVFARNENLNSDSVPADDWDGVKRFGESQG